MPSSAKLSIAYVEYNAHKVRFSFVIAYKIPKKKYISESEIIFSVRLHRNTCGCGRVSVLES